jgi:hypothetical protein
VVERGDGQKEVEGRITRLGLLIDLPRPIVPLIESWQHTSAVHHVY